MEQWKEYRLGEVVYILDNNSVPLSSKTRSNRKGFYPYYGAQGVIDYIDDYIFDGTYLLVAEDGENLKSHKQPIAQIAKGKYWVNNHAHILESNGICDIRYICYLLNTIDISGYVTGSAQPKLNQENLKAIRIKLPSLTTQIKIADLVSKFDDKIELNRKINSNLEEQAKALFKSWFIDFEPFKGGKFVDSELGKIPEGWKVLSLDNIADYLNGLAMQKYRPALGEQSFPVLKIKELGQGYCDASCDKCSSNVPSQYMVNDGDVIFSWSGTLMVDLWCGGKCGLNQHLFKVSSKDYPKWFYLMWTLEHLNRFIHIAKDKAVTMGHIKREELHKAKVVVPTTPIFNKANMLFAPIVDEMINTRISNRSLSVVRDTLLPKLMSGEIEV